MGSNAIIVFDMAGNKAWRVEHPFFHFDPGAGVYRVGGVNFFWSDGVSAAALAKKDKRGSRDLYLHPTSSTKLFKMSTDVLKDANATSDQINNSVELVGDRGPNSQATACAYDPKTNVLLFTQLCKNGVGCWSLKTPLQEANAPLVMSDCNLLEFPNDITVDANSSVWILSNRQSRFLYDSLDYDQFNFRILTVPVPTLIQNTTCDGKQKAHKEKTNKESTSKKKNSSTTSLESSSGSKSKGLFGRKKSAEKKK